MSLLNSSDYDKLGNVSSSTQKKSPGKFFSAFITGVSRPGQEIGKLQIMSDMDNGKYLKQNATEIQFIPYFIKRYWAKYIDAKSQSGQDYQKLVAFGWSEDIQKLDDSCKYAYAIAGLLLGDDGKAMKHTEELVDAEIKVGDPVLCYFSCHGVKFNGGMKFIETIAEKAKNLPPLSDSPEFEITVVSPRRFICKAVIGKAPSAHGEKMVFTFEVVKQLPDKAVQQVMDSAMTLMPEFEKQFDKTAQVRGGSSAGSGSAPASDAPTFADAPEPIPESDAGGDDFELGI